MSYKKKHGGSPWLYDSETGDFAGLKDDDGSEFLFARRANYGVFYSFSNQACVANTPQLIEFDTAGVDDAGIELSDGNDGVVFNRSGWFKFTITIQVNNAGTQINDVYLWGRLNGVDIDGTATRVCVTESHGGTDGALVFERSYFANVNIGDEIGVVLMAESSDVSLKSTPATSVPPMPFGPSVVLSVIEIAP